MDLGVESLWQKPGQGATYLWLASHLLQAPWCPGGTSVVQVQVFPQGPWGVPPPPARPGPALPVTKMRDVRASAEQEPSRPAPWLPPLQGPSPACLGGVAQGAAACQALIPPHLERCRSLAWGTWHTRQCSQPRMLPHQNLCMPAAEARSDASACCLNLCSRKEKL